MLRSFFLIKEDHIIAAIEEKSGYQWPLWRWILLVLNIIVLVLSVILSWHYLKGGSMVGCDGASSCEQVLSSRWSMIAGRVPVSGLAMGAYLAMLITGFYIGPDTEVPIRRLAWSVLLIIAGSIIGIAVWFTILQKWIIGEFCPYCMTAHITGLLMAAIIIWQAIKEFNNHHLHTAKLITGGLLVVCTLAVSQVFFTPQGLYSDGTSQDALPVMDYHTVPIVGSPDAPYVVKMLFDYECPHCQKLHFMLNDAVSRYNGKLAFVLCPTPLNTQCNPYIPHDEDAFKNSCELSKIGMAVWVADRKAYTAFDNWMFSFEAGSSWQPRSPGAAKAKAVELVGRVKFDTALSSPWIEQYIQTCVQIYGQTIQSGRGGVPKLIFGPHWVISQPADADDLLMILQKNLGVPQP